MKIGESVIIHKEKPLNLRIEEDLYKLMERYALEHEMSISQVVRTALRELVLASEDNGKKKRA